MSFLNEYSSQLNEELNFLSKKKEFVFSVIIPVYNVEDYLEETILSIINQTLDFEKHIEIILVNDGSPDDSKSVCLKYQKKYPENIKYFEKENGGVSSARNYGIRFAIGKFVNFLDSDDIIANDAFEKVYEFFSNNYEDIDVVCLPIYYFEARKGKHMLNFKFKSTKIIDIDENPEFIQLHVSSAFLKLDVAKSYSFDTKLKYGEDAKYITEIILEKKKYGVLSNAKYLYRIRSSQSSAIQMSKVSNAWYNDSLRFFSLELINISLAKFKTVIPYVQSIIMYDLQWKFRIADFPEGTLSEEEQNEFLSLTREVLQYVDDDVITSQKYINFHQKNFVFKVKYMNSNKKIFNSLKLHDNVKVFLNGKMINSLKEQQVYLNLIKISGSKIYIEGMFASVFPSKYININVLLNGERFSTNFVRRPLNDTKVWGIIAKEIHGFKTTLEIDELEKKNSIEFEVEFQGIKTRIGYKLSHTVKFSKKVPSYYAKDRLIIFPGKTNLIVVKKTFKRLLRKELGMIKRMLKIKRKKTGALKAIVVRGLYYLTKPFMKKTIYLFMDRIDKADDNAEVLYKYAVEQSDKIRKLFVISNKSSDYDRMKKYGKVVSYGSYKHKFYLLFCDKFISSHADEVILNPFKSMRLFYKNLLDFDFVFLQHGVIQNDMSSWLNKFQKDIKLFVTSSYPEYNSILEGNYGYTKNEVVCTGMPRHDRLENKRSKVILIMPTWRKNIASRLDNNFKRVYNTGFKKTKYFKMYDSLINHPEVISKLSEMGYKIKFIIHPTLKEQIIDFTANDHIEIINPDNVTYYRLFNEADLLITDYSSVAFDFAYLRKPVIYFQFDQGEFYRDHFSKGYFNYDILGFGPVVKDFNDMTLKMIESLENNCELPELYKERIDNFFAYADKENSKRVYEEIIKR